MRETDHETLINNFIEENPYYKRTGLNKELKKLGLETYYFGFLPDAYFIDEKSKTITLLEVEDSSPITKKKFNLLLDFWFFVDCNSWFLNLITINFLTKTKSKINDDEFFRLEYDRFYEQRQTA
jgi:hypothetical protein